jgi:hypothetical protein
MNYVYMDTLTKDEDIMIEAAGRTVEGIYSFTRATAFPVDHYQTISLNRQKHHTEKGVTVGR